MLLYTLLHGSRSFQEYVLVRSDPETLLLPVLQQLYQADKARANHLYMLQVKHRGWLTNQRQLEFELALVLACCGLWPHSKNRFQQHCLSPCSAKCMWSAWGGLEVWSGQLLAPSLVPYSR